MGFHFHKGSTKADWADDCREAIKQLTATDYYPESIFKSLDKLDKGALMALAEILGDAAKAKAMRSAAFRKESA